MTESRCALKKRRRVKDCDGEGKKSKSKIKSRIKSKIEIKIKKGRKGLFEPVSSLKESSIDSVFYSTLKMESSTGTERLSTLKVEVTPAGDPQEPGSELSRAVILILQLA